MTVSNVASFTADPVREAHLFKMRAHVAAYFIEFRIARAPDDACIARIKKAFLEVTAPKYSADLTELLRIRVKIESIDTLSKFDEEIGKAEAFYKECLTTIQKPLKERFE